MVPLKYKGTLLLVLRALSTRMGWSRGSNSIRRYSSMAEHLFRKQVTGVRFLVAAPFSEVPMRPLLQGGAGDF